MASPDYLPEYAPSTIPIERITTPDKKRASFRLTFSFKKHHAKSIIIGGVSPLETTPTMASGSTAVTTKEIMATEVP